MDDSKPALELAPGTRVRLTDYVYLSEGWRYPPGVEAVIVGPDTEMPTGAYILLQAESGVGFIAWPAEFDVLPATR